MKVLLGIDELRAAEGEHLGYSDWHRVSQDQVNQFAEATGDDQWIHVDPEQAADGPFGGTIAHGYLTLAMLPMLVREVYRVEGVGAGVNYGLNRVRFPSPVPVDSKIRAGVSLISVAQVDNGHLAFLRVTVERDGSNKPVCVADTISLLVTG